MSKQNVPAPARGNGALHQDTPPGRLDQHARDLLAAFADAHPNWGGIVLLPGDPSHWVHLSAGEVVSFQSFLTTRLAAALNASTACADMTQLGETMARPERLATHLRSAELCGNSGAILGALIGAELAAARIYWLGQQVVILGDGSIAATYGAALKDQGVPVETA